MLGAKADALMAAHLCSEAALRLVKPGNETYEITDTVSKIAEAFDCKVGLNILMKDSLFISFSSASRGDAVSPAGAKQNRWREDHHPESFRGSEKGA